MVMQKKFKFTNAKLKAITAHDKDSASTELELTNTIRTYMDTPTPSRFFRQKIPSAFFL